MVAGMTAATRMERREDSDDSGVMTHGSSKMRMMIWFQRYSCCRCCWLGLASLLFLELYVPLVGFFLWWLSQSQKVTTQHLSPLEDAPLLFLFVVLVVGEKSAAHGFFVGTTDHFFRIHV